MASTRTRRGAKATGKARGAKRTVKKAPRRAAAKATAKKVVKAVKARPARGPSAAARRKAELERLQRRERALERDAAPDQVRSTLADSPEYIPGALEDSLAEELGEASVASATSGEQAEESIRDEEFPEEEGGPFVETSARQEFARGTDASNPADAEPADVPTANARPRGRR